MKNLKTRKAERGFGFSELLVVIAVIGVLTSIAIPAMSGVFGKAEGARTMRNAQNIVSTFNAARAAGNSTSYSNSAEAIAAITTSPGINGGGIYSSNAFYVSMLPAQITEASARIASQLSGPPTEGNLIILP